MAQKVNLDVAEKLDITCRRGDSFSLSLTLKDSTGTAIDLGVGDDGYSFLMDVKGAKEAQSGGSFVRPIVASSHGHVSTIDTTLNSAFVFTKSATTGEVVLSATSEMMKLLPTGIYVYDIQQKDGVSAITTILKGSFRVNEDISG